MNHPIDDERWASGREAIEKEKKAARTWLAGRDWSAAGIGRKTPPLRRPARPARWAVAAATGIAVLFLGFLLLRPVFHKGSIGIRVAADPIQKAFVRVQSEDGVSFSAYDGLNEAAYSEVAWLIQRVFCAASLEDASMSGLPRFLERAWESLRREGENPPKETGPIGLRRSNLSEALLRFFQTIKEG